MKEPLKGVNTQMADPNEAPTIPQPAATVLLVRDTQDDGIEVFLIAVSYTHLTLPTNREV